jgi:hypothetical protein
LFIFTNIQRDREGGRAKLGRRKKRLLAAQSRALIDPEGEAEEGATDGDERRAESGEAL